MQELICTCPSIHPIFEQYFRRSPIKREKLSDSSQFFIPGKLRAFLIFNFCSFIHSFIHLFIHSFIHSIFFLGRRLGWNHESRGVNWKIWRPRRRRNYRPLWMENINSQQQKSRSTHHDASKRTNGCRIGVLQVTKYIQIAIHDQKCKVESRVEHY